MIKDDKAQTSVELILILATMMIIVLICGNFITDTLNDITTHLKTVLENLRNSTINSI